MPPAETPDGPALTTMPSLTVRPTSTGHIESLSGDSTEVRMMLERNLKGVSSNLIQGIAEGCTLTVSQENFGLVSAGEVLQAMTITNARFMPDEGDRWRVKGSKEEFIEVKGASTREFETTFDPTALNSNEAVDPSVPWDQVIGNGWSIIRQAARLEALLAATPLRQGREAEFYADSARSYFDYVLTFDYSRAEFYSYVGSSEMFGHESVRYEYRLQGPVLFSSSEETESLLVWEFARDNPSLNRYSEYQGPVDGELNLMQMNAVPEFRVEPC